VANRSLRERLVGSDNWTDFPSTCSSRVIVDGGISIDEFDYPTFGYSACAFRALDRATRLWSIYWITSLTGTLGPPVEGGFHEGRGVFYGKDIEAGCEVSVRFLWTRASADDLQWEQAFSVDEGATWETNWIMQFTRAV
jgi:hypothetical protein